MNSRNQSRWLNGLRFKQSHRLRLGLCLLGALLFCLSPVARAAGKSGLAGTYTIQGQKGAIVLTIKDEDEGKVSGSLKGGDFEATLLGFPDAQRGGVLGTMKNPQGQFISYFHAAKANAQLLFDLIEANAGGDPDFNRKNTIPFPIAGAPANAPDEKPDEPTEKPEAPTGKTPDFAGIFKDANLTLESKADAARPGVYSGTLKMAGQTFKFTARHDEGALRGEFESPDGKFPFEATLEGRTLTFNTDGTIYKLAKQGGNPLANPLAKPNNPLTKPANNPLAKPGNDNKTPDKSPDKPAVKPTGKPGEKPKEVAALPGRTTGGAAWKIYKHPTGLSVRYPPTWKLNMVEGIASLVPPDQASNAQGATEAYLILANGAEGVTTIEDPRVMPYLDGQLQQLMPFLQRVGEPQKLTVNATPGISATWEGTNPNGLSVRANVMATILKGYSVALLALGDKAKITARESITKEVFSSLAAGAGERDPALVGRWKFWGYKSSADGKFGTETSRRFQFLPDGTCLWQSTSESSGNFEGKNSAGEQIWTGGVAGKGTNGDRGQWTAGDGKLYVLWDDGSTGTWDYQIKAANGKRLFLTGASGKPDEWMPE